MARAKVLIADDQELFASGIEIILKGPGRDSVSVVGIATDGHEAVRLAGLHRPDVVLMDVRMPNMDGVEATRILSEKYPEVKVLMLTTFDDDRLVVEALRHGALGYLLKDVSPEDLIMSIVAVSNGSFLVSPSIGHRLVDLAERGGIAQAASESQYQGEINFLISCFDTLTTREAEILHLIMLDRDNHEIAEDLHVAEQTVKNRISTIYAKLGVADRIHARRHVRSVMLSKR